MATRTTYQYEDLPLLIARMTGDEKHGWAAHSTLDVVWVLYDRVLRVDPSRPDDSDRDRFLLSKGHGPIAFYAVLAAKGFLAPEDLDGFAGYESMLGHHPDRMLVPGVEIGSGSLGHGLPIAVGQAVSLGLRGSPARVFVLVGDGELDEGSNHEAIAFGARYGLENLTAVVIDNESSTHGWPGGIARRFAVEGWSTATVDGRDHDALEKALSVSGGGVPKAVVARVGRSH